VTSTSRLAQNLRYLRLEADLTQEQMAEITGMGLKFYQTLEAGRKPQIKVETVERLATPFGIEVWQILAPASILRQAKYKLPTSRIIARRGPRAKWANSETPPTA
jgi:transcriptional regulator with XRE-family HTH domain